MSIEKSIKNTLLTMNGLVSFTNNAPSQYADKQTQYFSPETKTFIQTYAKYSSDYVQCQVQGIDLSQPLGWQTRMLRMADVVRPSTAIQRHFDDYKIILFADRDIEYVQPGTKIVAMGSAWLAINPANISAADGGSLVRRCNAVWNFLDYYGNVLSEPIIVENERANANDSDSQESQYITKGYFNVICQYNEFTRQIDTNTRLILGTGAYRVTGYSDFETEFTGDYSTVRLLSFTVRYEEPNDTIDDMENHVAGGKSFTWNIRISGANSLTAGTTTQLVVQSSRNHETVQDTSEYPIDYTWESSDESVFTVDKNGLVTAVGAGDATVRVTLVQNTTQHINYAISVTESTDGVFFTSTVPKSIAAYDESVITAAFFENGEETGETVTFTFSGADEGSYGVLIGPKAVTIYCYGYSATPLTVTASYGIYSVSTDIELEGF